MEELGRRWREHRETSVRKWKLRVRGNSLKVTPMEQKHSIHTSNVRYIWRKMD
jgi:hypothetical protein